MSDIDSSLPVRTQNAGDIISKIADAVNPAQQMAVNANGSINVEGVDFDIRNLDAGQDSVTVVATDLDIRNLAFATDKVDVSGSEVSLSAGTLAALENITVSATDLDIRDLAFATDKVDVSGSEVSLDAATLAALENITVSATDLDIRDLAFATDKVDVSGSEVALDAGTLAALENITVSATDLDIRNLDAAQDSVKAFLNDEAGNPFSAANPLPVTLLESEGDEINDYNTVAAVAGGANDIHVYTVTSGKTLFLTQIEAAASGKMKIEIQVETGVASNSWVTKFVKFNSTAEPNISVILKEAITVLAGVRVRVIRTNRDAQAQDVYSSICGHEV